MSQKEDIREQIVEEYLTGRASDIRSLPKLDRADMEYFVQQLELVLPVIGFDVLRPTRQPARVTPEVPASDAAGLN